MFRLLLYACSCACLQQNWLVQCHLCWSSFGGALHNFERVPWGVLMVFQTFIMSRIISVTFSQRIEFKTSVWVWRRQLGSSLAYLLEFCCHSVTLGMATGLFCTSKWTRGSLCPHFHNTTSCLFGDWANHMMTQPWFACACPLSYRDSAYAI